MAHDHEDCTVEEIDGVVVVGLPLDQATVDWINRCSQETGDSPEEIIASILRHVRADDDVAHRLHH